jgi:parallel beta-helix repeat protein
MKSYRAIAIAFSLLLAVGAPALLAGPLNPPAGPIAPTAKPLAEIEPRTAINTTNVPGSAAAAHEITQNGSYYLTGDLFVPAGKMGLRITASNATIDLAGFQIYGVPGSGDGINTPFSAGGTTLIIKNGTLQALANGVSVYAQTLQVQNINAIDCTVDGLHLGGNAVRVDRCGSFRCTGDGFDVGADVIMTSCVAEFCSARAFNVSGTLTASDCSASGFGISSAGFYAFILNATNCTSSGCADGFSAASAITAANCTARNGQTGFYIRNSNGQATFNNCTAYASSIAGFALINTRNATISQCTADGAGTGFNPGVGSKLQGCIAANNTNVGISAVAPCQIIDCNVRGNGGHGISTGDGAMIDRCLVTSNSGNGIQVGGRSAVTNCNVSGHFGATAVGIYATFADSNIEGNTVTTNTTGIRVDGGCIVTRNKASGNIPNYSFNIGNGANLTGPIVNTPAGMSAAGAWANFEF